MKEQLYDTQSIIRHVVSRNWNFSDEYEEKDIFNLHPYPTKFIPQIPKALIEDVGVSPGGIVFDPFCGSGTTIIVAQSLGYKTFGIDLNPIACLITRVATSIYPDGFDNAITLCLQRAQSLDNLSFTNIPNVDHWFKKPIQNAISSIIGAIEAEQCDAIRDILRLALSSIIVKVSNQESDTRYAAIDKRVKADNVFRLFQKACERFSLILRDRHNQLPESTIFCTDSLAVSPQDFPGSVGLVICSPPYPNAYESWLYHKYRMFWLGYDPLYVKEREIGARPHFFKKNHQTPDYFRIQMQQLFELFSKVCIDNSYICFVLGDSKIHGQIIDNTALLCSAASVYKFEPITVLSRDIALSRKSFNITNSRARSENIIVFQKQRRTPNTQNHNIVVNFHAYKYFPYEKRLALRELAALPNIKTLYSHQDTVSIKLPLSSIKHLDKLVYFSGYSDNNGKITTTLQAKLEKYNSINGNGKRQSTRYSVHGLHDYKGKFNPQIVRSIINISNIKPGGRILDPFCGSGTTLIESSIGGYDSIGWDINPLAVYLSNTKISTLQTEPKLLQSIAKRITSQYDLTDDYTELKRDERIEYLSKWIPKNNLITVEKLRNIITSNSEELAPFFLVTLSDLLRDYSLQEPDDLRIRRRKSPMPSESIRYRFEKEINNRIKILQHSNNILGPIEVNARAYNVDCRNWDSIQKYYTNTELFDFVLTSPPYATALPYIDTQRLSLVWLGLLEPKSIRLKEESLIGNREASKEKLQLLSQSIDDNHANLPKAPWEYCMMLKQCLTDSDGFRRKAVPALLYQYFEHMMITFHIIKKVVKSQGVYSMVVGINHTTLGGKKFYIDTPRFLSNLAEQQGWSITELTPLETYKRYGLHSANAVRNETLLVMRK
ncbi:DNA methyltransferase [Chloroflexota bacterium]